MKTRRALALPFALVAVLLLVAVPAYAGSIGYSFSNGSTNGWVFPYNSGMSQGPAVWGVENGVLVESYFGDNNVGYVRDASLSDFVLEAQVKSAGVAGVVLWYSQVDNTWANYVAITRSTQGPLSVNEFINGEMVGTPYSAPWWSGDWYSVRVEANGLTGALRVHVDDPLMGPYEFTHVASTPYRTGRAGVVSGNHYGYFDDFRLTSDELVTVPDPGSTLLFLGISLVGLRAWRKCVSARFPRLL